MKKHVLALLAAGIVAGQAHGQSSVTMYGVVDSNVEYVNSMRTAAGNGGSLVRLNSGGFAASRWGMRGVEDLGSGLNAVFVLEGGLSVDTGMQSNATRLFDRQAYVGLKSKEWGQLTFGRQYTSLLLGLGNYTPTAYATQYEPVFYMTGLNLRGDNTISYVGTFGGLTARANWSFGNGAFGAGETPGQASANTGYGAALEYANGPFGVAVAYDQYNPTATALGDPGVGRSRKAAIAGSYDFGPVLLTGGYRWGRNEYSNDATALRDDFFWLGAQYRATSALSLTLAYYYDILRTARPAFTAAEASPANPYQVTFISSYAFSRRTNVYLSSAFAKHAPLNFSGVNPTATSTTYLLGAGKDSQVGVALGIRHIF